MEQQMVNEAIRQAKRLIDQNIEITSVLSDGREHVDLIHAQNSKELSESPYDIAGLILHRDSTLIAAELFSGSRKITDAQAQSALDLMCEIHFPPEEEQAS
jgi:hypothetical protein